MADGNESTGQLAVASKTAERSGAGGLARKALLSRLADIQRGEIEIRDADSSVVVGRATPEYPLRAVIDVHDSSMYTDIVLGGSIGAAESYMEGKWTVCDLTTLMRVLSANPEVVEAMEDGLAKFTGWAFRIGHLLRRNSRRQSRRNIGAHYDLGDDLFALFLDPTMSYSSGIYPREDSSLSEAAVHKLNLVCEKLQLQPDDHLLEIGTGWGGLAVHAASNYGCRVTTTTISENQHRLAVERVAKAGLSDRVTVLKQDYRELDGQFDKLVSIEMIEAVGHDYMDSYFKVCSERLKPHGRALIQAILMSDRNFENYRGSVDFIQKYIFPGGALPSVTSIMRAAQDHTDLQIADFHDIGGHYARTLRDWRSNFMDRVHDIKALGYPDEFVRMWEFYFCYCEGGFAERAITTAQIIFDKPMCRLVDA